MSVILAIAVLLLLVMIHELGHFIGARMTRIPVKQFSVGFGPRLVGWKSKKHETEFMLRLLPLGGYCMFYDDEDGEDGAEQRAMSRYAAWRRALTIVMGPLMNLVLAFVIAVVLYVSAGMLPRGGALLAEVAPDSAAMEAGLEQQDVITAINGIVVDGNFSEVFDAELLKAVDEPMTITVRRDTETFDAALTPRYSEADERYMIGISYMVERYEPLPLGMAFSYAFSTCVDVSTAILDTLRDLVFKGQGLDQMSGPAGVVSAIAEQAREQNWTNIVYYIILISINLGLFNLLPVPGLDGSRLVFLALEAARGKPVSQKVESIVHLCGFVLLLGLIILFTYQDIARLISPN